MGSIIAPPLVHAVIVNHNQPLATADQLRRHRTIDPIRFDQFAWTVVSNGQLAPEEVPGVTFLQTDNQGYGSAINRAAHQTPSETILALNADLVPEPGFLEGVERAAHRMIESRPRPERVGITGFRLLDADGSPQGSVGHFPTLGRFLTGLLRSRPTRKYTRTESKSSPEVDWVTGACMLIDRDCFTALRGFDESFFLYYEDVDFCLRAHQKGWRTCHDPSAACRHLFPYHSRRLTIRMVYVARRALLLYFRKHRPAWESQSLRTIARAECSIRSLRHRGWRAVGQMIDELPRLPTDTPMEVQRWPSDPIE